MKLQSSLQDVVALGPRDRESMFELMAQSYANMRRDRFDADLDAKRWAILVRCPASLRIVGFSTQTILAARVAGQRVHALYSGDTVVAREHWGDPALAHAWGNFALMLVDRYPGRPLYWFLTSKGFRTYRYLPLFFRTYYPRPGVPTPAREQAIIDALGKRVGGEWYDASRTIIRAAAEKDFVRPEFAGLGARPGTDSHVRFFVERNPGFGHGDELCCLAPLSRENFTRAAYRVIHSHPQPASAV